MGSPFVLSCLISVSPNLRFPTTWNTVLPKCLSFDLISFMTFPINCRYFLFLNMFIYCKLYRQGHCTEPRKCTLKNQMERMNQWSWLGRWSLRHKENRINLSYISYSSKWSNKGVCLTPQLLLFELWHENFLFLLYCLKIFFTFKSLDLC